jgi:hypothetical protein
LLHSFDNPAALKTSLEEYVGLSETEYNLLYTVYSIPNIVLPFFGEWAVLVKSLNATTNHNRVAVLIGS